MTMKKMETLAAVFLGCVLGSIILQFAAPILLAILVSGASLVIPFLIYHLFVTKGWRIRLEREEEERGPKGDGWTEEARADRDALKMSAEKKGTEQNGGNKQEANDMSSEEESALLWYNETGRSRLNEIITKLNSRGISTCWIRSDGICSYRTAKGFRRIGIFYGYPGKSSSFIAGLLREDGMNVTEQKQYLRLSWKPAEEAA